MVGLDVYVGSIDWMNAGSGLLKAAGGAFGGGGGSADANAAAAAAAAKAQADKAAAEKSASNWKLIGVLGIAVIIGGALYYRSRMPAVGQKRIA